MELLSYVDKKSNVRELPWPGITIAVLPLPIAHFDFARVAD